MKKLIKIFYLGILFFWSCSMVSAEEDLLAICHYDAPLQNETTVSFSVSINTDGNLTFDPEHGYTIPNTAMLFVYNIDSENYFNEIYSDGKLSTCPNLSLCVDSGTAYHVQEQNYCATTSTNGYLMSGTLENISGTTEKEDLSKTLCEERKMSIRTRGDISFTFGLDKDGNKIWSIKSVDGTSSGEIPYNMEITVGPAIFAIDESLYDILWQDDNCSKTPLYLKNLYSDQIKYIVVDEPPDSSENGTVDNWNGFEKVDNTGNDEGFSPNSLCKDEENCNINLNGFCGEPTVSRVLKFIGLIIFIAKILVPAIIIIMGFVTLFKIITSGKEDEAKKQVKNIIRNIVIGILIFLLPSLINFVFDIADDIISPGETSDFSNCVNCLTDPNNSSKCIIQESDND